MFLKTKVDDEDILVYKQVLDVLSFNTYAKYMLH